MLFRIHNYVAKARQYSLILAVHFGESIRTRS